MKSTGTIPQACAEPFSLERLCVQLGWPQGDFSSSLVLPSTRDGWGAFCDQARVCRLAAWVYVGIKQQRLEDSIPPEFLRELEHTYYTQFARYETLRKEVNELIQAFEPRRIPLLWVKGWALGETVYDEPWLRVMEDIDWIVPSRHLESACTLLQELQFKPRTTGEFVFEKSVGPQQLVIDLEPDDQIWYIRFLERNERTAWLESLWAGSRAVAKPDVSFLIPSSEDHLVYLVAHHLVTHGFLYLDGLIDLALLADPRAGLNWDRVLHDLKRFRLSGPFWLAVERLHTLIPQAISRPVVHALEEQARHACWPWRLTERVFTRSEPIVNIGHFLYPLYLTGWRARWRFLKEQFFPERTFLVRRYGIQKGFAWPFFYLVRMVLQLAGMMRVLGQLIFLPPASSKPTALKNGKGRVTPHRPD